MATDDTASIIPLHQARPALPTAGKSKAKTPAERAKAYRARKAAAKSPTLPDSLEPVDTTHHNTTPHVTAQHLTAQHVTSRVTPSPVMPVTSPVTEPVIVTPSRRHGWRLPEPPTFAALEKNTAELVAACERGMAAARFLFGREGA